MGRHRRGLTVILRRESFVVKTALTCLHTRTEFEVASILLPAEVRRVKSRLTVVVG
jgi:hypothetical protein